jgi:hypothetical protein
MRVCDGLVARYKEMYLEVKKQNNMKTFKDLEFIDHPNHRGGIQARITFENGYGASVIKSPYSYGGKIGLYELAVLDEDGWICNDTPVSEDGVIGYLREEDVSEGMIRIQNLPTIDTTNNTK